MIFWVVCSCCICYYWLHRGMGGKGFGGHFFLPPFYCLPFTGSNTPHLLTTYLLFWCIRDTFSFPISFPAFPPTYGVAHPSFRPLWNSFFSLMYTVSSTSFMWLKQNFPLPPSPRHRPSTSCSLICKSYWVRIRVPTQPPTRISPGWFSGSWCFQNGHISID